MKQRLHGHRLGAALLLILGSVAGLAAPAWATVGRQGTVEFFLGGYNISEPRFKEIYPTGGTVPAVSLTSTLFWNIDLCLEVKELNRTGKLTFTGEKTTLILVPLSLGLRYVQPLWLFQPYIGAGFDIYLFYENNPIETVFNYVRGSHFEGGTYIQFHKSVPVLVNFKLKYTTANFTRNDITVKLGGLEYSAGLALAF
jgi:hypothetical protein